ncbi:MAG: hypothetical protein R3C61_24475 [Bacteroidia bacterium]
MNRFSPKYAVLLLLLLTFTGVMGWFGQVFFHPNQYLFSGAGDGLRAYYATGYDLNHSTEKIFSGVMYPHGVPRVYMDMNPLLTAVMKFVQQFADISPYAVGIINILMILSFFPAAYFSYLLLRKTLIPPLPAVIFALLITFLSPQIRRLTGHFPLSYSFVLPMFWLILLKISENRKNLKWLIIYGLSVTFFSFAHPYYFLLGAAFLSSWLLVHWIQHAGRRHSFLGFYIGGIFTALAPGLILKFWEMITTPAGDEFVRYPYGFLHYMAGFESVFLPSQPPLFDWLRQLISIRRLDSEGYAYVGITGFFVLLLVLVRIFILLRKKQGKKIIHPVLPDTLKIALWAGVILLIPAFAYPFQLFPDLLEFVPFIRQFRSLGRLAWIFYEVFMVFSAYYLYAIFRLWKIKGKLITAFVILISGIVLWATEAVILARNERKVILANHIDQFPERSADFSEILQKQGLLPSDFQAIIALPFFHIGSEKLQVSDWMANRMAFAVSQNTGLPLVNFTAARTPLDYSLEAVNLVSHPLIPKTLPAKLTDNRPFLLVYPGGSLTPGEQALVDRAEMAGNWKETRFFRLNIENIPQPDERLINDYCSKKDSLWKKSGELFLSTPADFFYWNTFGDHFCVPGKNALASEKRFTTLFEGELSLGGEPVQFELSFWTNLDIHSNYLSQINVKLFNGEQMIDWQKIPVVDTRDVMDNMARVAAVFTVPSSETHILIDTRTENRWFDNVLIRPLGVDVIIDSDTTGCQMYNNYLICPD